MCTLGPAVEGYVSSLDTPAPTGTSRDVKRLVSGVCPKGCGTVGVVRNPTSPNAITLATEGRASKIAYSPAFVDTVARLYGPGATLGIFAHEIGHHVDANSPAPAWMAARWGSELRADAWAGCALAKVGGKATDMRAAVQALATYPSAGHPPWAERAVVLQTGYRSCGGTPIAELDAGKNDGKNGGGGTGAAVRGCAVDSECKGGRMCLDGTCQERSLRRSCSKDIECPGLQICAAAGVCQSPAATGSAAGSATASVRATPSSGPSTCQDRCGDDEETCAGHADRTLRACKTELVSDPRYKECSCPRWPSNRLDCYQVCKEAFDKSKTCEAAHEMAGSSCLSLAARCASDCT